MRDDERTGYLPPDPPGYFGKALLTAFLYTLGWLAGFVVNIVFYSDAKRDARMYGREPSDLGCLAFMLWFNLVMPLIVIILVVLVVSQR